jgi:hypothetical protein
VKIRRGDPIPRPNPWKVRAADRNAGKGWDTLVAHHPEAADRTWVAITSDPRRTDGRQHQLKGSLAMVVVGGRSLDQWQYEVTGARRVWYAIDDSARTLWVTEARIGHPKETETRRNQRR